MLLPLSVIVLAVSFVLIAVRRVGSVRLQIWQIVLGGAIAVLVTGQISVAAAISYIDPTIIVFLIGIFILGEALTSSGYIQYLAYRLFKRFRFVDHLVLAILFSMGFASMFMLNDTMAIIGTPVVMFFSAREGINQKLMLLSLAFAITIGSVASPIGNPQNLLVASSGLVKEPFIAFFSYLLIPTMVSLFVAYLALRLFFKGEFHNKPLMHDHIRIKDNELSRLCRLSMILLGISISVYVVIEVFNLAQGLSFAYIAVIAALPILLFSKRRVSIVKGVDWPTIVFFIALFVLVGSVWQSGFLQHIINSLHLDINYVPTVLIVNVVGSQFVSNVPMVMLYLKLLEYTHATAATAMALAAGSTIAGNLFILGAASNVIIVQMAEKRYRSSLSFFDFAKVGVVVTALSMVIYWAFLTV
ncbi:MAG: SLC13 family permease [Candidatus Marsarchaeota archaeon]|nr:SLC13 family permease [Candidatus Marsarchaeota archaeon]MCL5413045.1 SLC13 family permease [Candidatus Marsarchaeota archaeon]